MNPVNAAQPLADFLHQLRQQSQAGGSSPFATNPYAAPARPIDIEALPLVIQHLLATPLSAFTNVASEPADPNAQPLTHVGFALDSSGSMSHGKAETIAGFNQQLEAVRAGAESVGDTRVTLVDFANDTTVRTLASAVGNLSPLTAETYRTQGGTALYDAIGALVTQLLAQPHIDAPSTAVWVTLFTDGEDNQSKRYSPAVVRELIQKLEATGRWTFALVGPQHGINQLADRLGVNPRNVTGFDPSSVADRVDVFGRMAAASTAYMTLRASGATQVQGLYDSQG